LAVLLPSSGTVRQFLGVPYALAKRWEAPQDPANRTTAINATDYSGTCPQLLNKFWLEFLQLVGVNETQATVPESEDCLTVNIWAPSLERKQNKTAVMIWLYGGGFQFGTVSVQPLAHVHRSSLVPLLLSEQLLRI
jgi:carboxylesterase type B